MLSEQMICKIHAGNPHRFGLATLATLLSVTVAAAQAQTPVPHHSGRGAIDRLVGNTMVTSLPIPDETVQDGKLLLREDGTAIWVNIEKDARPLAITWRVNTAEQLCLDGLPKGFQTDGCVDIEVSGTRIVIRFGDTSSEGRLNIRLEAGNPYGL